MENIGIISFYGLLFGIIGTSIGGFIVDGASFAVDVIQKIIKSIVG